MSGKVFLVGAGPGDAGLLTVKAARLLASAEVVVLDALVSPDIIQQIPSGCRIIDAGKRAGQHTLSQDQINGLLIEEARAGRRVIRLKGGDPFVFGRGGEEAEELQKAGIPFEVVPGISSGLAGPAYAGIPVTHRTLATSITLVTGHESDESAGIDWEVLGRIEGTVVFLMGLSRLNSIASKLIEHGRRPDTPVAVISHATTMSQRTVSGTLSNIVEEVAKTALAAPALIVVGDVVRMRQRIDWFESKPLFGRRVVVTRAREQSSDLKSALEEAGANVIEFPTIEIAAPASFESLDRVIEAMETYAWLIFTSQNGVRSFFKRLREKGQDSRALSRARIAAVGDSTAEELGRHGIVADLVPEKFQSDALLPLLPSDMNGIRVALIRAESGRSELIKGIQARGGIVDLAIAYRSVPRYDFVPELRELIQGKLIDIVTFTSSSTVENFFSALSSDERASLLSRAAVASIGPVTSKTLRDLGVEIRIEARSASVSSLVEAIFESMLTSRIGV